MSSKAAAGNRNALNRDTGLRLWKYYNKDNSSGSSQSISTYRILNTISSSNKIDIKVVVVLLKE